MSTGVDSKATRLLGSSAADLESTLNCIRDPDALLAVTTDTIAVMRKANRDKKTHFKCLAKHARRALKMMEEQPND